MGGWSSMAKSSSGRDDLGLRRALGDRMLPLVVASTNVFTNAIPLSTVLRQPWSPYLVPLPVMKSRSTVK